SRTAWALNSENATAVSGFTAARPGSKASELVERAADRRRQVLRLNRRARVVARRLLGRHLDLGVRRNELVRDRDALDDLDAVYDQRLVFHVAHGSEAIDAGDAEPVQHVGHELLEARVLHAGDAFRALEIGRGGVATLLALSRVVHEELGDLPQRAPLL